MSLKVATSDILTQLDAVIRQLKPEDYIRRSSLLNSSTIGQHVRHTLEFFICLIDGMPNGVVNYDDRKRDNMIEEDVDFACKVIRGIHDFVETQNSNPDLTLKANFGSPEEAEVCIPSNYLRELTYNIEHAIHHMALIRVAVAEFCDYVKLPEDFGVASSTVRNKVASR